MIAYLFHHHINLEPSSNYISIDPHPKFNQIPPKYSYKIVIRSPVQSTIILSSDHHQIPPPSTYYPFHYYITLEPSSNSTSIHPHPKYRQIPPEYSYKIVIWSPILSTIISTSNLHQIPHPSTYCPFLYYITLEPSSNSTSIHPRPKTPSNTTRI